jgi:hypothetical protein
MNFRINDNRLNIVNNDNEILNKLITELKDTISQLNKKICILEESNKELNSANTGLVIENQNLSTQMNSLVIDNNNMKQKINDKDIEIFFDEKINGIKREIKLKQQELEMYHQVFGHTYKINYKLKNKLETEYKYQNFYNQQHEKYSIIKHTTLYKLKKQEQLLNGLNQYFEKFITSNEEIINEK